MDRHGADGECHSGQQCGSDPCLPAHAAVLQKVGAGPSTACQGISHALHSLGVMHECHVLSPDGTQVVDILLPQQSIALVLERHGGYVVNTGKRRGVCSLQLSCLQYVCH